MKVNYFIISVGLQLSERLTAELNTGAVHRGLLNPAECSRVRAWLRRRPPPWQRCRPGGPEPAPTAPYTACPATPGVRDGVRDGQGRGTSHTGRSGTRYVRKGMVRDGVRVARDGQGRGTSGTGQSGTEYERQGTVRDGIRALRDGQGRDMSVAGRSGMGYEHCGTVRDGI